jgi:hypothetical protein
MQPAAPRILSRTATLLRIKERLVFYAIALFALDVAASLLTGWLGHHKPLAMLLQSSYDHTPLLAAIRHPTPAIVAATLVYFALAAWYGAGYLRSIIGMRHFGARDGAQFRALLGLFLILAAIGDAFSYASERIGDSAGAAAALLLIAALAVGLIVLYTDYSIVISGGGPLAALRRSLRVVRVNLAISVFVLIATQLVADLVLGTTAAAASGPWRHVLPLVVIRVVALGSLKFVADVALICVYIDTIERGALPEATE